MQNTIEKYILQKNKKDIVVRGIVVFHTYTYTTWNKLF
jgi:hypothetical protein